MRRLTFCMSLDPEVMKRFDEIAFTVGGRSRMVEMLIREFLTTSDPQKLANDLSQRGPRLRQQQEQPAPEPQPG